MVGILQHLLSIGTNLNLHANFKQDVIGNSVSYFRSVRLRCERTSFKPKLSCAAQLITSVRLHPDCMRALCRERAGRILLCSTHKNIYAYKNKIVKVATSKQSNDG